MEPHDKELVKPVLMIAGIIGFIICIVFTTGGQFSEIFGTTPTEESFDFGTNIGVALSIGFLILFLGSLVSITPQMVEKEH